MLWPLLYQIGLSERRKTGHPEPVRLAGKKCMRAALGAVVATITLGLFQIAGTIGGADAQTYPSRAINPDAIIRKVSVDMRKALDEPDIKVKLAALGAFLRPMTPAEVTAFSQDQQKIWRPVAEHVAKEATQAK